MNDFTLNNGGCQMNAKGCCRNSALKLSTFDWLCDLPENVSETDLVEVQFKNTRKGYYNNVDHLPLQKGDIVAVEASPGHDIGEVTLTGRLVLLQMNKNHITPDRYEFKKIYRIARELDLQKRAESKAREQETMIQARQIAQQLGLNMKIGDVEFQGDGTKAIFYYIADERVDFRQLIKVFADTFHVRIEMKQIGARQEAGRIGGFGPCGRELCCAKWMTNFNSVTTGAARLQDLSLNPQKLAGLCAKLKCCLNFEVDVYKDALKNFPEKNTTLETISGTYYCIKTDALAGLATYSTDPRIPANLETITAKRACEIVEMNRRGEKPDRLGGVNATVKPNAEPAYDFENVVGQDDVTRFDKPDNKRNDRRNNNRNRNRGADRRDRARDNRREGRSDGRQDAGGAQAQADRRAASHDRQRGDRRPDNRHGGNDRRNKTDKQQNQ
ncbi:MAG: hypothetical protein IJ680_00980 [Paludibacteraceae bacterium]|nr:hypothetical protein [Paludibacteraceae bacterium]